MLQKVTDRQYLKYIARLTRSMLDATTQKELQLLYPSLVMAQRQATTMARTWTIIGLLRDFDSCSRRLPRSSDV